MKTSYFARIAALKTDPRTLISIARSAPRAYSGPSYLALAPSWDLLNMYKANGDKDLYENHYQHMVLNELDPEKVYRELTNMGTEEAVLLCWEGKGKFCHRHIVSKWLSDSLKIEIPEL
jgi:hypothetical protein